MKSVPGKQFSAGYKYDPLTHLNVLMPLFTRMLQGQGGQPIAAGEGWKNDRQTLAKKFLYHLRTLLKMTEGESIQLENGVHHFVDHGSIDVITRAIIENFIVFEWVFGPTDESLSHFRYLTWVAAGLNERAKVPVFTAEGRELQASAKDDFAKAYEKVKSNKHFKELSGGAQKSLLKGDWRMGQSIAEIAVKVHFHPRQFSALYSYLCSYSHSSYISAMQIGLADDTTEKHLARMSLSAAANMTARIITTYAQLFPLAEEVLNSASPDEKFSVNIWNLQRDSFESTYGADAVTTPREEKDVQPVRKEEP